MKGIQYIAHALREVSFDETMFLARLSDIDNNACDIGKLLHDRIPFWLELFNFLFKIRSVNACDFQESEGKRTPRIWSA